ncbi:MAG TPA: Rv3235 family protein [Nitriliruptoraceae bacterium]|nr:Rv3235 family protein [Nitriliruptoraceae bacterium]
MTGRPPEQTSTRVIPPGPADPGGRDLLSRAVIAATWYLEIRAGRRPVTHLQDWVSPAVARQLDGLVRRRRRQPRTGATSISLLRVWAQRHDGVAHVVVVLREHQRTRPVALAVQVATADPRIIALGLPEDRTGSVAATPPSATPDTPRAVATDQDDPPPVLDDRLLAGSARRDQPRPTPRGTRMVGVERVLDAASRTPVPEEAVSA